MDANLVCVCVSNIGIPSPNPMGAGFDNPCFERDHPISRSPTLVAEVPLVPPKARRASLLFPAYLRRTESIANSTAGSNTISSGTSSNLLSAGQPGEGTVQPDCMTAQSTQLLQPFDCAPSIDNYIHRGSFYSNIDMPNQVS